MVIEILGKEMFDAHIAESNNLVMVDFWAERCGPCKMLKPVLHDISEKRDNVDLLTINVDAPENSDLTMQFSVRSIPQVTLFKGGESVDQFIGALPPEQIEALLDKHTGGEASPSEESQEQSE